MDTTGKVGVQEQPTNERLALSSVMPMFSLLRCTTDDDPLRVWLCYDDLRIFMGRSFSKSRRLTIVASIPRIASRPLGNRRPFSRTSWCSFLFARHSTITYLRATMSSPCKREN